MRHARVHLKIVDAARDCGRMAAHGRCGATDGRVHHTFGPTTVVVCCHTTAVAGSCAPDSTISRRTRHAQHNWQPEVIFARLTAYPENRQRGLGSR